MLPSPWLMFASGRQRYVWWKKLSLCIFKKKWWRQPTGMKLNWIKPIFFRLFYSLSEKNFNMESYRYQTPSTYKYIKYFKEKPLSDWEEEDFIRFYDGNDVSKTKRSGLQASFSYCLNCIILQDQDVPDDIKEIVKMKRKDIRVSKTKRSGKIVYWYITFYQSSPINTPKLFMLVAKSPIAWILELKWLL